MKKIIIALVLVTTGCTSVPVARKFPDVPEYLKTSCPDLMEIDSNTKKLSDVVKVVAANYGTYQECKIKAESWLNWYNTQKQIFESVK